MLSDDLSLTNSSWLPLPHESKTASSFIASALQLIQTVTVKKGTGEPAGSKDVFNSPGDVKTADPENRNAVFDIPNLLVAQLNPSGIPTVKAPMPSALDKE